jgi:hypothetical protein
LEALLREIETWFAEKREHLSAFAKFDCRVEGWFKAELLVLFSRLVASGMVDHFEREANVPSDVVDAAGILAALLFVDEVIGFFRDYLPDVTTAAFFDALLTDPDVQIPELLVMVDPKLKTDVVVAAYRELRAAVRRAMEEGAG